MNIIGVSWLCMILIDVTTASACRGSGHGCNLLKPVPIVGPRGLQGPPGPPGPAATNCSCSCLSIPFNRTTTTTVQNVTQYFVQIDSVQNWTVPDGVTQITVKSFSGGGGGGGGNGGLNSNSGLAGGGGGGGGSAGAENIGVFRVVPGDIVQVVQMGQGGAGSLGTLSTPFCENIAGPGQPGTATIVSVGGTTMYGVGGNGADGHVTCNVGFGPGGAATGSGTVLPNPASNLISFVSIFGPAGQDGEPNFQPIPSRGGTGGAGGSITPDGGIGGAGGTRGVATGNAFCTFPAGNGGVAGFPGAGGGGGGGAAATLPNTQVCVGGNGSAGANGAVYIFYNITTNVTQTVTTPILINTCSNGQEGDVTLIEPGTPFSGPGATTLADVLVTVTTSSNRVLLESNGAFDILSGTTPTGVTLQLILGGSVQATRVYSNLGTTSAVEWSLGTLIKNLGIGTYVLELQASTSTGAAAQVTTVPNTSKMYYTVINTLL